MTTIGSPVYGGNSNNPLWLSASPTSISLAGTAPLVLTNIGGVLAENGVLSAPTAQWSLYPATSNTIKMDASNTITNSGANLYYNGNLIANASDISNIADWALYNAISDINLASGGSNNSIVGARNITAISNVSAGSVTSSGAVSGTTGTFTTQVVTPVVISASNLSVSATSNLTQYCGTILSNNAPTISNSFVNNYNILGNRGIDYSDFCYTNISNKGGKGGQINLTADAGSVTISGTTYGVGGLINITANSPLTLPYNATSAIKLSAASILSYAGAVSPVGSLAGYNYIQGTLGVNIVAGSASSVPNTAGTNYIWGANGTKIRNYLYTDTIANDTGTDLRIQADTGRSSGGSNNLYLSNVKSIIMEGSNGEAGSLMSIDGSYITSSSNKGNSFIKNFAGFDNIGYINSPGAGSFGGVLAGNTVKGFTLQGSSLQPYLGYFPGGRCDLTLLAPATPGEAVVNNDIILNASCNIRLITSNSGQVQVTGTITASNITSSSNLTLSATSNLNLNGSVLVNGTPIASGSSNWSTFPATQTVNLSNYAIINASAIDATGNLNLTSTNATTGFVSLVGGSNYSRIILQAGQPLNISSSNTIQLQGQSLAIYSPVDAGNNTISNVNGLTMSSGANINMTGGGINTIGAMTFSNGSLTANGNFPLSSTGDIRINADYQNLVSGAGLYLKVGAPGLPYHQIQAQQGQPMYLSSSNYISVGGTSTYLPSPVISQNTFSRLLSSSNVAQPVIQYGTATGSGSSGTVVVTIPAAYTGSGTYVVQVTMRDAPTAQLYATPTSGSSFTIGWSSAGGGTQNIMWTTFGT